MKRGAAPRAADLVQHFFATQLSGFFQFNHFSFILIRAHIVQI